MRMRCIRNAAVLSLLTLSACDGSGGDEVGVDVFSADTAPARLGIVVSGTLEIGLRADQMYTAPDRSIVLQTPATLVIQRGEGAATVSSLDTLRRIVVQPTGIALDSADVLGVTGIAVTFTRKKSERRVTLAVDRP